MDNEKTDLTFDFLDDLALATVRRRLDPASHLGATRISRVGPFLEFLALCRSNLTPLDALPGSSALRSLLCALRTDRRGTAVCADFSDTAIGFIATSRDPHAEDQVQWTAFCRKAQQAAELALPKPIAQGLVGAIREIEENVHLHSERVHDGVVAFRGMREEFEFAVMDSGIGLLGSLRKSPDYQHLTDSGDAIRIALTDGQSRLSHLEPGHGYGFQHLFVELANLGGELRFRSGDNALTIDGTAPSLVTARISQKVEVLGFAASVVCRFRPTLQ